MFNLYVCYVPILVVVIKDVVEDFDVVLAATAAPEVRTLACFSVRNEFRHFSMSVHNEFKCL